MVISESEYQSCRAELLKLYTEREVSRVSLSSGKTVEYFDRQSRIEKLEAIVTSYEIANGTTATRTYARNIRRR